MAENTRVKPHALLVPFPGQGHIVPMMIVALKLAKNGVTITLASFRRHIMSIKVKHARELGSLDFHLVELDHDPGEIDNIKVTMPVVLEALAHGFQSVAEKLEYDRRAGHAIPSCIMADFLLFWTEDVAVRLCMKRYVFFPSGAILPKLYQEVPVLIDTGKLQLGENNFVMPFDGVIDIPGVAAVKYQELPLSVIKFALQIKSMNEGEAATRSIVVNTFYDLEPKPIDLYRKRSSSSESGRKAVKVYATGPIVTTSTFVDHAYTSSMVSRDSDCLSWLDTQPASSVLFICLGSMVRLVPQQIEQLAVALEASENCRFLWVLHKGNDNFQVLEDALPEGFEAKVKGRGLVTTGWVPQILVLAHPAILGFLSHCGWGSTMESVTWGVPMIGWPHGAEQFLNCRYLVDELKVATEVLRGADRIVQREEFERAFSILLGEEGKAMKGRCQELKLKGAAAVATGGSSEKAFLELMEDMKL